MQTIVTDCLVIGSGSAGSVYAHQASHAGLDVTLLSGRPDLSAGNSAYAQGGIVLEEVDADLLRQDMATATAGTYNPVALEQLIEHGPRLVRELLIDELGVAFDRDAAGELRYTREAAHSRERIVFAKDQTGRAIVDALHRRLAQIASATTKSGHGLRLRPNSVAVDLLTLSHSSTEPLDRYEPLTCVGAYVLDVDSGEVSAVLAKKTILATGGLGQTFLHTTNHDDSFGHGTAMAYRVGARIIDLEYIQFHPTVFLQPQAGPFLISEAVRGEGGILVNASGRAFMEDYHELGSLAPRDIISRSIHRELLKTGASSAFLDVSALDAKYAQERFPTIHNRLLTAGIDMTRTPIPVVPAAHYSCGGVHADMRGTTSVRNLSAIGEVACTGLHGANRLASTSLLECVVMGDLAAAHHAKEIATETFRLPQIHEWRMPEQLPDDDLITQDLSLIRNTMWNYVGLVRTTRRLERATSLLRELKAEVDSFYADNRLTRALVSLRNAVETALLVTYAALHNPRSRGSHYRSDDDG
jgi:L-aspartate oxidase